MPLIERQGITLVGVAVANLDDERAVQLELPLDRCDGGALDAALDEVRDRFGVGAITRAVLLGRDQGIDGAAASGLSELAPSGRDDVEAVDTPHGPANAHLHAAEDARAALVLGHGAGGGVTSRDLVAVTGVARALGISVALVEQPYRVAGRRSPAPAHQLDAAWIAVVEHLRSASCSRAFR